MSAEIVQPDASTSKSQNRPSRRLKRHADVPPTRAVTSRKGAVPVVPIVFFGAVVPLAGFLMAGSFWSGGDVIDDGLLWQQVDKQSLSVSVIERGNLESQLNREIQCEVEDVQRDGINGTPILWIVANGSSVKKGDLLVELESAPMQETLDEQILDTENAVSNKIQAEANFSNQQVQNETTEAEAELRVQLANLELQMFIDKESGTYKLEVEKIKRGIDDVNNQILEAQASLELRRDDQRGIDSLYKLGYANRNELRKSKLLFLQAEGKYAAQLNQLETSLATLRRKENYEREMELLTLKGKVKTAERAQQQVKRNNEAKLAQYTAILRARTETLKKEEERLERYTKQLAACKIYAPEAGMVAYATDRSDEIREGVPVRYRQHILSLPSLDQMQVQTVVHESDLDQIQIGMKARVTVDAFPEKEFTGTVDSIAVLPEDNGWRGSDTKVYPTVVTIDDRVEQLKPGMTAVTEILIDAVDDVMVAPVQAVVERDDQTWVLARQDGRVTARIIQTGMTNQSVVEIHEGLLPGEYIALNPRDSFDSVLERSP
ncbi:MAG: efflux RND transporter periplasmic adaptor subunit [Planctomycetota bacterium]